MCIFTIIKETKWEGKKEITEIKSRNRTDRKRKKGKYEKVESLPKKQKTKNLRTPLTSNEDKVCLVRTHIGYLDGVTITEDECVVGLTLHILLLIFTF